MSEANLNLMEELTTLLSPKNEPLPTTALNFEPIPSTADLHRVLAGHVNGLLSLKELTPQQVELLIVLLRHIPTS